MVVRDYGGGIKPRVQRAEDAPGGIGLPVIRALAHRAEFVDLDPGPGTEVRMEFATATAPTLEEPEAELLFEFPPTEANEAAAETMVLAIAPSSLARSVLPRVLSGLAARAHFSTDRIAEAQLLADTLITRTDGLIGASHLNVDMGVAPRMLGLRLGPLHAGRAEELLGEDAGGHGLCSMLDRLADSLRGGAGRLLERCSRCSSPLAGKQARARRASSASRQRKEDDMPAAQSQRRAKPTCRLSVTPLVGGGRGGLATATARGDTGIQFHAPLAEALNRRAEKSRRTSRVTGFAATPSGQLIDQARCFQAPGDQRESRSKTWWLYSHSY